MHVTSRRLLAQICCPEPSQSGAPPSASTAPFTIAQIVHPRNVNPAPGAVVKLVAVEYLIFRAPW